jgi:two-component system response regulator PhoP
MRILLVEDEAPLRETLSARLKREGFAVDSAQDGEEGLYMGREVPFDLGIIDLGLPKMSGMELIKALRDEGKKFPVLILTARSSWQDKVEGLKQGADDYLVKPFHVEELLARINALVRRAAGWSKPTLECGPVVLDLAAQTVTVNGANVDLTSYEYKVLEYLMMHAGELVSKADLTEHIYQQDFDRDSNVLEVFIGRLRKKLDPKANSSRSRPCAAEAIVSRSPAPGTDAALHGRRDPGRAPVGPAFERDDAWLRAQAPSAGRAVRRSLARAFLQSRQLLAASLGLVAFLALAGYAWTARSSNRPEQPAYARKVRAGRTARIEFLAMARFTSPTSRPSPVRTPGSGLYRSVLPTALGFAVAQGPDCRWAMLAPAADASKARCRSRAATASRRDLPPRQRPGVGRRRTGSRVPVHRLHLRGHQRAVAAGARVPPRVVGVSRRCRPRAVAAADARAALEPASAAPGRRRTQARASRPDRTHERAPSARTRTAHRKHQRLHPERARKPGSPAQHAGRPRT